MADTELIDRYIDQLRTRLRRYRDVDDLAEEIADHLHTSARRWRDLGHDDQDAQRRTLAAFGDHELVAKTYVEQRRRGLALPTRFTHTAGTVALAGGVGWLVGSTLIMLATVADRTRPWEGLPQTLYVPGAYALTLGALAVWVGLLGVYRRHGGGGAIPTAALTLLGLGSLASFAAWFVFLWIPLLGLGGVLFALWLRGLGLAPRAAVLMVGAGPVTAAAVVAAGTAVFGLTWPDTAQLALRATFLVALALFAAGTMSLGRWLRSEIPVDDPDRALFP